MARVRFLADHDYRPTRRVTIAYKAGFVGTVKRDCADQAVALGKAVDLDAAGEMKPAAPTEESAE
jgi:hypothetical protein